MSANVWLQMIEKNPGHSAWYINRFKEMAAEGQDLDGEARFVPRDSRILDAGCGPGRVGGRLAALGHQVVGVDLDPALIAEAEIQFPGVPWLTRDLSTLDLAGEGLPDGVAEPFDVIVSAGNVMTFLDPATRRDVLRQLVAHLAPGGRLVVGFGADRGYDFDEFFANASAVGLQSEVNLSTWDLRPFDANASFLVAILAAA